jgi:hypothetical protein
MKQVVRDTGRYTASYINSSARSEREGGIPGYRAKHRKEQVQCSYTHVASASQSLGRDFRSRPMGRVDAI